MWEKGCGWRTLLSAHRRTDGAMMASGEAPVPNRYGAYYRVGLRGLREITASV
jgi:hypothetical protein